ncbi:hypothetical protein [uncultured Gammaproteobacteria bacterium]|nr:hypothetical protein [uncultured Gammaproteobacteria bacterium]CAC9559719.1 hypothetical protein [uncultured Gammaproteobacteria bacterium]CAC9564395.1 hypothetical protein [uncultured Gammaproteobacteria bacterium]CAC9568810.1 hypothetical protein [uncultured Gammaproteobacteria bacterium]CAC9961959.1 hypothetical protein [uncultured Gammaproteobacteria bacterium]
MSISGNTEKHAVLHIKAKDDSHSDAESKEVIITLENIVNTGGC